MGLKPIATPSNCGNFLKIQVLSYIGNGVVAEIKELRYSKKLEYEIPNNPGIEMDNPQPRI
jgi:hypothetical protein